MAIDRRGAAPEEVRLPGAFAVETTRAQFAPSAPIFAQNDLCSTVMFVEKGRVKVFVTSPSGKRAVVAVLAPGDFFGEAALAGQTRRTSTAQALTACTIVVVQVGEMRALLRRQPALADAFMTHLLARIGRLESDVVDHVLSDTEQRLARALVLLVGHPGRKRSREAAPIISQGLLAEMIGTSRSRVNRFMTKFRRLGFITYDAGSGGGLEVRAPLLHLLRQRDPRKQRSRGPRLAGSR